MLTFSHHNAAHHLDNEDKPNLNQFAQDLYSTIIEGRSQENVIYSPAAIHSGISLAYIAAEGETAEKLRHDLKLGAGDRLEVAKYFANFLQKSFKSNQKENAPEVRMANRLYNSDELDITAEFKKIAHDYLETETEAIKFSEPESARKQINAWLEQQTAGKIQNILKPSDIDAHTTTVLVNGVYFKGGWLKPFSPLNTKSAPFFLKEKQPQQDIELMYNRNQFRYAELPDLNACALELPYNNSDFTMLIILPHEANGLEQLETKLKAQDLNEIASKLQDTLVDVYLPKFRLNYDLNMKAIVSKMGLSYIFSPESNFEAYFAKPPKRNRSESLKHQAYLDVNEYGSEAAASSCKKISNYFLKLISF